MLNWQYVKGFNQDNEGHNLYTFLYFQPRITTEQSDFLDFQHVPSVCISATNNLSTYGEFGHIITQKAQNQTIDETIAFKKQVWITEDTITSGSKPTDEGLILPYGIGLWSKTANKTDSYRKILYINSDKRVTLGNAYLHDSQNIGIQIPIGMEITGANGFLTINKYVSIGTNNIDENSAGSLYVQHKCQAEYFNATSDRRAKDNLKILNFKALDLINHTNLYSFRYKDTDTNSIGIIAQDVQDINLNGFKLVDNENATGQDMDYMTIHESKLVYILWKAIQEQQKEIEELKSKIKED